jgi:hypothetical protein
VWTTLNTEGELVGALQRAHESFIAWDRFFDFVADSLRGMAGPSPLRGSVFGFTIPLEPRVAIDVPVGVFLLEFGIG